MDLEYIYLDPAVDRGPTVSPEYHFFDYWRTLGSDGLMNAGEYKLLLAFDCSGDEIGRALIEPDIERKCFNDEYTLPCDGPLLVKIWYIDVKEELRGRGFGSCIVEELIEKYSDHQLIAFVERSEGFWESLGWTDSAPVVPGYQTAFISRLSAGGEVG